MKSVYMEQRGSSGDVQHNKFFELKDDGRTVIATWGAINTKGQSKVLVESEDPAVRQAAWDKKFKEKAHRKDKPYVVIKKDGEQVEDRPSADGRRWGLEVATHSNLELREIARRMQERGLKVNLESGRYFHSTGATWDIKRDGSCGYEFASPISSGERGIFDAKVAVEKIREVCPNAVNSNCGVHVTVDVSDHSPRDLKRLAVGYLRAQEHFYTQCNESRQQNRYCKRNPTQNISQMIAMHPDSIQRILDLAGGWRNHDDRYHGLNFTRVFSIKVVEFRMLESTVAIRKVGAWIEMCVGFVDGLKKSGVEFKSTGQFSEETFNRILSGTFTV